MKAYLCSVDEETRFIAKAQLERFGFEVVELAENVLWPDKYLYFLHTANEDCIRVDADVIVNKNIVWAKELPSIKNLLMAQFQVYDLYQNNIQVGQPVFYSKNVFPIILNRIKFMNELRPETWAWRLPEVDPHTMNVGGLVGMHGFFQNKEGRLRAHWNKKHRNQIERYDFALVEQLEDILR